MARLICIKDGNFFSGFKYYTTDICYWAYPLRNYPKDSLIIVIIGNVMGLGNSKDFILLSEYRDSQIDSILE